MEYPIAVRAVHREKHPFEPCENSFDLIRHPLGIEYVRRFLAEQQAMIKTRCKYIYTGSCSVSPHYGMLPEISQLFTGVTLSEKYFEDMTYDADISWKRIQALYTKFTQDIESGEFAKFLLSAPCKDWRTEYCFDRQKIVGKIDWIKSSIDNLFARLTDLHQQLATISKRHRLVANMPDDSDSKSDKILHIEYVKRIRGAGMIHELEKEFFELVSVGYSETMDNPSTGASGGF